MQAFFALLVRPILGRPSCVRRLRAPAKHGTLTPMLSLLAAALAAGQPGPSADPDFPHRTAWIVATVGHSEWCPAGNVRLDLVSGRYALTPRASRRVCDEAGLERPVTEGRLDADRLAAVRAAYRRVLAEGLESPACADGGRPERLVISNGGPQILLLATGAETGLAPDDLSCWSDAAFALHDALDEAFESAHDR